MHDLAHRCWTEDEYLDPRFGRMRQVLLDIHRETVHQRLADPSPPNHVPLMR